MIKKYYQYVQILQINKVFKYLKFEIGSIGNYRRRRAGFTLIETIVTIGIFTLLIALVVPGFASSISSASINTITTVFVSDLKSQQIKAMTGDTEGRGTPEPHGIHITATSYILFQGASFNASDDLNFEVPVDSKYTLSTSFPSDNIVFEQGSGEIVGFTASQNTITIIEDTSGAVEEIQLNQYGVIE